MAKLSFSKLGLKTNQDIVNVEYNGQTIEVKQYLPMNDKLELVSSVIEDAANSSELSFVNWGRVAVYTTIAIFEGYTNITFTEKQKEDPCKLYDLIAGCGLDSKIVEAIPAAEYNHTIKLINDTVTGFYTQKNSALGIIESITSDYANLDLEASSIQQKLADPNNLELLKGIMTKLG